MKISSLPFNITLYKDVPNSYLEMIPVLTGQLFDSSNGDFNPKGLYSNTIFGRKGEKERDVKESFINLRVPVFNPLIFSYLVDLKSLYKDILYREGYARFDPKLKDFVRADVLSGETGFSFFMSHFKEIDFKRNNSKRRDLWIDLVDKFREKSFIKHFVVIPAGLRDIEITEDGQPKEEEINKLYRRIISVTNTINADFETRNSELLDAAKANLQQAIQAVFEYVMKMISGGKRSLLQSKYASRRVSGGTRNVLSSQEVGAAVFNDARQPGPNKTTSGLFQYLKGHEVWLTEYAFRNGFFKDIYSDRDNHVPLINRKTLLAEPVSLSNKTRDKWMTSEGMRQMVNIFEDVNLRHKPVTIDGYYLKLVYNDGKVLKILNQISELPKNLKKSNVHPVTWGEMFYLLVQSSVKKIRGIVTRYPITGLGSTYLSRIYLKSTVTGSRLSWLDENWEPTKEEVLEFPEMGVAWFETMSVHPSRLSGLGADFDGDVLSLTFVSADESVSQIDEIINDLNRQLDPRGGLVDPLISEETELALSFMTGHN